MKSVAIVDDDEAARQALEFLLKVLGWLPESFSSAAGFLDVGDRKFACLILDQHMPSMTGLDLARELRSGGDNTPILLISGDLTPDVVDQARDVGIDLVSEKPPELGVLSAFVGAAMSAA